MRQLFEVDEAGDHSESRSEFATSVGSTQAGFSHSSKTAARDIFITNCQRDGHVASGMWRRACVSGMCVGKRIGHVCRVCVSGSASGSASGKRVRLASGKVCRAATHVVRRPCFTKAHQSTLFRIRY
jgi:hypothetical protein